MADLRLQQCLISASLQSKIYLMPFVYKQEKKFPVIIPIVLLLLWMAGSTWYWVCEVKGLCTDSVVINK